ncbi:hypothetical protein Xcc3_23170 [Xanthomonas campestris pv. campestris]|nr:hypothetical protein Xcc3_23170 [Xanthomonas campestris pv. campestris]
MRHRVTRAHRIEHGLQIIQRLLRGIEMMRLQHGLAGARHAEGFFGGVAQLHHGLDRQKAGAALERVEAAEHRVELVGFVWRLFQRHQLFAEAIQDFLGLDDEIGSNIVWNSTHGYNPNPDSRSSASSCDTA